MRKLSARLGVCLVAFVFIALFCNGCGDTAPAPQKTESSSSAPDQAAASAPANDEKSCFQCGGAGTNPCRASRCAAGKVECPGPCLKLSRGPWIRMNVAGHDPKELWRKFPEAGGGYQAWNQNHVGEVVVMQKGKAVNTGKCNVCSGTTKVNCSACKGEGKQPCHICEGKTTIPKEWTATDNPWLNRQPDLVRLKDGRVLLGRVSNLSGDERGIKTREGKFVRVNASEILPSAVSEAKP